MRSLLCIAAASLFWAAPPVAPVKAAGLSGKSGVFKVVKPPSRGARKRLVINEVTRSLPPGRGGTRAQRHTWFWQATSPTRAAADAARLEALAPNAAQRLGGARDAVVERIRKEYGAEITAAARAANVSEALLIALVAAESAGRSQAVSSKGAAGLGQLMPATAARFGVQDRFDPAENLRGAAEYLSLLLTLFDEDALLALAGYNAGEGAVARHNGVPPFNETRDYVPIVLSYYHHSRGLCANDPRGPRANCTFKE